MNKTLTILMAVFLIGTVSAMNVDVTQTESNDGIITLEFYLNNPDNTEFNSYGVGYYINSSQLRPISQLKGENNVFDGLDVKIELIGVLNNISSISMKLNDGNFSNISGSLGVMSFERLVEGNIALTPFQNVINNGQWVLLDFPSEVIFEEYVEPVCTPNWVLGSYGECNSGSQTAEYTDSNLCGEQAPTIETQSCGSSGGGGSFGGGGSSSSSSSFDYKCNGIWECTSWSNCVDSLQTRLCIRPKGCTSDSQRPMETQYCQMSIEFNNEDKVVDAPALNPPLETDEGFGKFILVLSLGLVFVIVFVIIAKFSDKKEEELEYEEEPEEA